MMAHIPEARVNPDTARRGNRFFRWPAWGGLGAYLLIVFEILYMAGPFAAYFYSLYNPVLNLLNASPHLSVLTRFFLPHVVRETASPLLDSHNYLGAILALGGFLGFLVGACMIYYHKFSGKGMVSGGIYRHVRHPQYTSFIICSFGMLLLWPRFIVLIAFISMIFVYYFLARSEERECLQKFGESYRLYMERTGMFLPRIGRGKPESTVSSVKVSVLKNLGIYSLVLLLGCVMAYGLQEASIASLYSISDESSLSLSLSRIDHTKLQNLVDIARADDGLQEILSENSTAFVINYVLPSEWYAAEIPMNGVRYREGHRSPKDYDDMLYKLIVCGAELYDRTLPTTRLLTNTQELLPLAEVWVDLRSEQVTQILSIPEQTTYSGIPVALY